MNFAQELRQIVEGRAQSTKPKEWAEKYYDETLKPRMRDKASRGWTSFAVLEQEFETSNAKRDAISLILRLDGFHVQVQHRQILIQW